MMGYLLATPHKLLLVLLMAAHFALNNNAAAENVTLSPTASGFEVVFDRAIDPNSLNLYDSNIQTGATLGRADVTVIGTNSGRVVGSLVVDRSGAQRITFVRTGGALLPDDYTVTLRGSVDGLRYADGTAIFSDDFVQTFRAVTASGVVISAPDLAVGPGQLVNLPFDSVGLPIKLIIPPGNTIVRVSFTMLFDPALLIVTGVFPASLPASATLETIDTSTPGAVSVTISAPGGVGPGSVTMLRLVAQVPSTAVYGAANLLSFKDTSINSGSIAAIEDDGVHAVAYLGDTTGNGSYSALDGQRVLRVVSGLDSGFAAYPLIDPAIIGDTTWNGSLSALDATRILQEVAQLDRPEIPPLPPSAALAEWSGYGRNSQHTAISPVPSQALNRIIWQTPVDLQPQYSGNNLLAHYGSPLVTTANTVIVPVKIGATDGFKLEARRGSDGLLLYTLPTDYSLPPGRWTPSFGPALSGDRLYYAGAGGTIYYRDQVDSPSGAAGQIAFYGNANYNANPAAFNDTVKISTPITADRFGNIFFGYTVLAGNSLNLESGIARISSNGVGSFVTASVAAGGDPSITKVPYNCAPALSNDHNVLYFAVSAGNNGAGYLVSVDSFTLSPIARIRLKDPRNLADGLIFDESTASPTVGPDGDVYYGILENSFPSHNARGWLLHFDGALSQIKTPGAFGWDVTASIVTSNMVPSYEGASPYLVLTKYNNYAGIGGDGVNRMAVLDPNAIMTDPISEVSVMNEVLTIAGPTPDNPTPEFPNAVREWCINTAVIDPFTKSALVNNEDGLLYRWDFTTNTLSERVVLTAGIGEAYTPTLVGVDGTVYAINNGILFAVGR